MILSALYLALPTIACDRSQENKQSLFIGCRALGFIYGIPKEQNNLAGSLSGISTSQKVDH